MAKDLQTRLNKAIALIKRLKNPNSAHDDLLEKGYFSLEEDVNKFLCEEKRETP